MIGNWMGKEYPNDLDAYGTHMIIRKRHYVLPNTYNEYSHSVCGKSMSKYSLHEGREGCEKCIAWCEKNEPGALEVF